MGERMTNIEELVAAADKLCATLEKAAQDEMQFSYTICNELERMSWETFKMANQLKTLRT
jgi:hypothetical protein